MDKYQTLTPALSPAQYMDPQELVCMSLAAKKIGKMEDTHQEAFRTRDILKTFPMQVFREQRGEVFTSLNKNSACS